MSLSLHALNHRPCRELSPVAACKVHAYAVRWCTHDMLVLMAGKSAMLRWAAKVAGHAVATSGRGASAAGLMASAVKDSSTGSWGLEAGAFVLADGGLCCLVRACPRS